MNAEANRKSMQGGIKGFMHPVVQNGEVVCIVTGLQKVEPPNRFPEWPQSKAC